MKSKMIVAVAMIALSTIGIQTKAEAQRTRVHVTAPLPGGGQLSVRGGNGGGYNGYGNGYNDSRYYRNERGNYGRRGYDNDRGRGYRNEYRGRGCRNEYRGRRYNNCNRRDWR